VRRRCRLCTYCTAAVLGDLDAANSPAGLIVGWRPCTHAMMLTLGEHPRTLECSGWHLARGQRTHARRPKQGERGSGDGPHTPCGRAPCWSRLPHTSHTLWHKSRAALTQSGRASHWGSACGRPRPSGQRTPRRPGHCPPTRQTAPAATTHHGRTAA